MPVLCQNTSAQLLNLGDTQVFIYLFLNRRLCIPFNLYFKLYQIKIEPHDTLSAFKYF